MPELYRCVLNPSGPNYAEWFRIFGGMNVPLLSPYPIKADLGEPVKEKDVECYLLNVRAMPLWSRARLTSFLAQKFNVPQYEISTQLDAAGCPIRAEDVVVEISMRAVV